MTTIMEFSRQLHKIPLLVRGYFNLIEHLYSEYHGRQFRDSGEPYIEHICDVMRQVLEFERKHNPDNPDWGAVVAAGGHDLIEDTAENPSCKRITKGIIKKAFSEQDGRFGQRVAFLIETVSKRPKADFPHKQARLTEYHQRLHLCARRDPKVLIIKLADRRHNLFTLHGLSHDPSKQRRIAQETLDFYAPLADEFAGIYPQYSLWINECIHQMTCVALAFLPHEYQVDYINL